MENLKKEVVELDEVVIRFSGDSGDGMQLTGTLFSNTSALFGNDVSTFPDYPAEIRAPQGTVGGVSGFQLHFGKKQIFTPGDYADVLVAMNPAAVKANLRWVKQGGTIIVDADSFTDKNLEKAGYSQDPLKDDKLGNYNIVEVPITNLTKQSIEDLGLDNKSVLRCKNMFALGLVYYIFSRPLEHTLNFIETKFGAKDPRVVEANKRVLQAGFNYGDNLQLLRSYLVQPADIPAGKYRSINGNIATAWGLLAAAEKSGLRLFLGSYPITPASEILQEISARKDLGAVCFQAEDEIAGICTAIGASFAGCLAATSTSGPGLSLKAEAIGLAAITELPLVIVNVQRGGPSTGLPTKTEQSDLLQALYGRHGECPVPVIAASTPSDCFYYAYEAGRIAVEHMTPVILLTDGFLANGSEPWKITKMSELPEIKPPFAQKDKPYLPYLRNAETMVREWAVPGTPGLEHRVGGLEKMAVTGTVSYVPENHQVMTFEREEKVKRIVAKVPDLKVFGNQNGGKLLVIGWGSTYGYIITAVKEMQDEGHDIAMLHFNYINPLPKNTAEILKLYKKLVVCELNLGQFANYLRIKHQQFNYLQYNKVQGQPFTVLELKEHFYKLLKEE